MRLGLQTLKGAAFDLTATLVVLGDQPHVSVMVLRALLDTPRDRPIIVPLYAEGGGQNPILLGRAAWALASKLKGDRGFGPLMALHPDLVTEVSVAGSNPDVDTLSDLQALESDWSRRSTRPRRP